MHYIDKLPVLLSEGFSAANGILQRRLGHKASSCPLMSDPLLPRVATAGGLVDTTFSSLKREAVNAILNT